ncbi:MAG: VTT domain-containing protein [Isosphaeraceae bacterium]
MEWIESIRQLLDARTVVNLGYIAMALVVFTETGLMIGFCLPGDSLLITAGMFASAAISSNESVKDLKLDLLMLNLWLVPAAILGDTVGYWIGYHSGKRLFTKEESILFHRKHLVRAQEFYTEHGGKTIIIARFIPIIRTFAPIVAGIGQMNYVRFLQFNVVGGFLWVTGLTSIGYFLGQKFPWLVNSLEKLIIAVVFLSILPIIIHGVKDRLKARKAALPKDAT